MSDSGPARLTEHLTRGPATALHGLLGGPDPRLDGGLPLLWHWVYLLDRPAEGQLGADGHPSTGSVQAPPRPGLRRMWAGGRVRCLAPVMLDAPATRESTVAEVTPKTGRSGALTFVTIAHRITQAGTTRIEEQQQLVYRETTGPAPAAAPSPGPTHPEPARPGEWELPITPVLLFRFSALTYNAHRIHYDRDYAREVEGYPGLLVHGPLQALAMAEAARRLTDLPPAGVELDYRLTSPLFDTQGLLVCAQIDEADAVRATVRDSSGRVTAQGTLRRRP